MSIKDELDAELKNALRARDRARLDVIRQIHTEVTRAMAEPGFSGDADDALYQLIIRGYTKKMDKARAEYESYGERGAAMAAKLAFETEYLGRWLPAAASADDVRALVEAAVADLGVDDPKQAGRVIGHIMKSNPGIDGAAVNATVREVLGA
ncbi:MAG: GatB/YqeY domain-containing protein [Acidimicrobiia bacterium]|nr:GatB/YqeY domain-containing protein [Acidimicrobiia bacterium]